MGAICAKNGKFFTKYSDKYFKQEDTIDFLKQILHHHKNSGDKICIFWDNASIHKVTQVTEFMEKNRLAQVRNVPYEPENNGIETLWGAMKFDFRKQLTQLKLNNARLSTQDII